MSSSVETSDSGTIPVAGSPRAGCCPQRVLVTGAGGFIGSHLVERLLAEGRCVIGLDERSPWRNAEARRNLGAVLDHPHLRFVQADVGHPSVVLLLEGVTTVFHLAGQSGVRESWGRHFTRYAEVNILGTQHLLEACWAVGVQRVVLASSSSVYGPSAGRPFRENDPAAPLSPYGVSKLAAERLALAYGRRTRVPFEVVALRYFTVYGPRQRTSMLIARVLEAALTGEPVPVFGDGSQRRHFTFIDDAIAATAAAGRCSVDSPCVLNVAGPSTASVREVIEAATSTTGTHVRFCLQAERGGEAVITEADLDRAASVLGYRPGVGLTQGIAAQWHWLSRTTAAEEPPAASSIPAREGK